jgi:TonB family protein
MNRRDHTFALALIASLLLHAAIVFVVADNAMHGIGDGGAPRTLAATAPEIPYLIPTPPPPQQLDNLFGDARGTGNASNTRLGDEPLLSRDAGTVQPFLSRDPVGVGMVDKEPTMSVLPSGSTMMSPLKGLPPPPASEVPFGVSERAEKWSLPNVARARERYAPPAPKPAPLGDARAPAAAAADPAVMSDSESDPFTANGTNAAVVFRDGRVDARFGRKVKTIRPHLSFSSQMDLLGMQFPRMRVRVHIHTDGTVRRVDIVRSSGSPAADQEVKVALYQWWFEPTKEEEVEFSIVWR